MCIFNSGTATKTILKSTVDMVRKEQRIQNTQMKLKVRKKSGRQSMNKNKNKKATNTIDTEPTMSVMTSNMRSEHE